MTNRYLVGLNSFSCTAKCSHFTTACKQPVAKYTKYSHYVSGCATEQQFVQREIKWELMPRVIKVIYTKSLTTVTLQ